MGGLVVGGMPADPFIEGDFDVEAGGGFGGAAGFAAVAAGGEFYGVCVVGRVICIEEQEGAGGLDLFEDSRGATGDSAVVGPFHLDDVSTEQESLGSLSHKYLYR